MTPDQRDAVNDDALAVLTDAGIVDAEEDLRQLRQHFLGTPKPDPDAFQAALQQRRARIPLGHILGHATFDGAVFDVGQGAFVPRQQSLPLIEALVACAAGRTSLRIADLCAGVGPLGISLARRLQPANVRFVEYSPVALTYLQRNIARLVPDACPCEVYPTDIFSVGDGIDALADSHIVVANPPFVPHGQASMPEFAVHHPQDAIFSGPDGTDAVRQCLRIAERALVSGGLLGIEHHESQSEVVASLLRRLRFAQITHRLDGDGKLRITTAVKP